MRGINQGDGNSLDGGLRNGQQKPSIDIVSAQFGYRF